MAALRASLLEAGQAAAAHGLERARLEARDAQLAKVQAAFSSNALAATLLCHRAPQGDTCHSIYIRPSWRENRLWDSLLNSPRETERAPCEQVLADAEKRSAAQKEALDAAMNDAEVWHHSLSQVPPHIIGARHGSGNLMQCKARSSANG